MTVKEKIQSLIASANETTGESDTTLTDAVDSLIEGYGQGGEKIVTFTSSLNNVFTAGTYTGIDKLIFTDTGITTGSAGFRNVTGISHIVLNSERTTWSNLFYASPSETTLKEVTILSDSSIVTDWRGAFQGRAGLKKINGILDMSNAGLANSSFADCEALEEVRFTPNSIKIAWSPAGTTFMYGLSDDSFVSMVNALDASVSKTFTFKYYSHFRDMKGKVEAGVFVKDESGTVTINDFITNTKGWTVAI